MITLFIKNLCFLNWAQPNYPRKFLQDVIRVLGPKYNQKKKICAQQFSDN